MKYTIKWDGEKIGISQADKTHLEFALQEVLRKICQIMGSHNQDEADCWIWGRVTVGDLCSGESDFHFQYGGEEDLPDDGLGAFAVIWKK